MHTCLYCGLPLREARQKYMLRPSQNIGCVVKATVTASGTFCRRAERHEKAELQDMWAAELCLAWQTQKSGNVGTSFRRRLSAPSAPPSSLNYKSTPGCPPSRHWEVEIQVQTFSLECYWCVLQRWRQRRLLLLSHLRPLRRRRSYSLAARQLSCRHHLHQQHHHHLSTMSRTAMSHLASRHLQKTATILTASAQIFRSQQQPTMRP